MVETDETRREKLVDYMVEEGPVSGDAMQRHLLEADQSERSLVEILYDEAETGEAGEALARSMADLFDAEVVDVEELDGHPATMTILPETLARQKGVLGCADPDREDRLALVVYDPVTVDALVETVTAAAGAPPRIFLAPRGPLLEKIGDFYDAFSASGVDGEEALPVASVLSGVRPLDLNVSLDQQDESVEVADDADESILSEADALRDESTRPDDGDAPDESSDGDLEDDSFGEDFERAVSDSLDDLGDVFDDAESDETVEEDWLSDSGDEDWLEETSDADDGDESETSGSGIRYPGSAEEVGGESSDGEASDDESSRPAVGAEKRGSTPFGEVVEPSAGLDEDTATRTPDIEQTGEMVPGEEEPVIDTSPQGDGPQVDDAFADAWPQDDESTASEGNREESGRASQPAQMDGRQETGDQSGGAPDVDLETVIDVADELSGPEAESLDPELSQSASRQTVIEMVEQHGRMLKRLNDKVSYQKRIIEELARLLVEARVIARGDLYERLRTIRREFTDSDDSHE
jgi:hypothetical protein